MLTPYDQTELRLIYVVLILLTATLVLAVSSWRDMRALQGPEWREYPGRLWRRFRICSLCAIALAVAWAITWLVAP